MVNSIGLMAVWKGYDERLSRCWEGTHMGSGTEQTRNRGHDPEILRNAEEYVPSEIR